MTAYILDTNALIFYLYNPEQLSKAAVDIVDIKLKEFSVENAVAVMNLFMVKTRYHYSAYFIRFNEGNLVRYRYATCKENREGFYCDVVIS